MSDKLRVYYDGDCPLCQAEIAFYQKRIDRSAADFINLSTADDAALGDGLTCEAALARFHVRDADGRLHSGASAFARIWLVTPGFGWLGRLMLTPGVRHLADAAYGVFLHVRPALQRFVRRANRSNVAPDRA